jgi:polyribonucleotide nucleotidyltransferase
VSQTFETQFGGKTLTIETGKLARLAGGSVTVRYGDTMVLGTANRSEPRPGLDFFPLTVDFEERMYAAGKIPGGFIKREARPSEAAILAARLTDRPIRPLFPEGYKDDVQIVITVLSTDQENDPDVLGTVAASAALTISEIPFQGPIGAVRVGRINGEFVINPTFDQVEESEPSDDGPVARAVLLHEIREKAAALADELEEAAARMVVLREASEVPRQALDPLREERDLDLW